MLELHKYLERCKTDVTTICDNNLTNWIEIDKRIQKDDNIRKLYNHPWNDVNRILRSNIGILLTAMIVL